MTSLSGPFTHDGVTGPAEHAVVARSHRARLRVAARARAWRVDGTVTALTVRATPKERKDPWARSSSSFAAVVLFPVTARRGSGGVLKTPTDRPVCARPIIYPERVPARGTPTPMENHQHTQLGVGQRMHRIEGPADLLLW